MSDVIAEHQQWSRTGPNGQQMVVVPVRVDGTVVVSIEVLAQLMTDAGLQRVPDIAVSD